MSRHKWILVAVGVAVLIWLVSDVNVNATITEGVGAVIRQNGSIIPQTDAPAPATSSATQSTGGPGITYGTFTTPSYLD